MPLSRSLGQARLLIYTFYRDDWCSFIIRYVTMKTMSCGWLAVLMMLFGIPAEAEPPGPHSHAEATRIIADRRRIVIDQGIERLEKAHIGGIGQWVAIHGTDRRNPVLLMQVFDHIATTDEPDQP